MKKYYRELIIKKIKSLSKKEFEQINNQLAYNLFNTHLWTESDTIGISVSYKHEWDTKNIISYALKKGKEICVPVTIADNKMQFYKIDSLDDLHLGNYGILEPKIQTKNIVKKSEIDLLIIPGVVFDRNGYRIGYGKGYYDRYLADFHNITLSLVSQNQLIDSIPTDSYDINVDYLISENGIISTK